MKSLGNWYKNNELNLKIDYLPENLGLKIINGDEKEGSLIFESVEAVDELYGGYIKLVFSWAEIDFDTFLLSDEIQALIAVCSKAGRQFEKFSTFHKSHECESLIYNKTFVIKNRTYEQIMIHGFYFSEHTGRKITFECSILSNIFNNWKETLLNIIESAKFH